MSWGGVREADVRATWGVCVCHPSHRQATAGGLPQANLVSVQRSIRSHGELWSRVG